MLYRNFSAVALPFSALLLVAIAMVLPTQTGFAHGNATGIVKERMDAMEQMQVGMKRIAAMYKGEVAHDYSEIAAIAREMQQHAEDIVGFFPDTEESRHGTDTDAHRSIWSEPDRFVSMVMEFDVAADTMEQAAADSDENGTLVAFKRVAKSCKVCHKNFRTTKR